MEKSIWDDAFIQQRDIFERLSVCQQNLLLLKVQNTVFSSMQEADNTGQAAYRKTQKKISHYEMKSRFTIKQGNREGVGGGRQRALATWMNNL